MPEIVIKLPDIGEGIAEAEISEWQIEVGEWINEDDVLGVVLTDKAAVEIPSSVSGKVLWRAGEPGDLLAVGAPLIRIDVMDADGDSDAPEPESEAEESPSTAGTEPLDTPDAAPAVDTDETAPAPPVKLQRTGPVVLAAPAVRKRAADLAVDLGRLTGTGPDGRVTHGDLDRHIAGKEGHPIRPSEDDVIETRIIGLRRKIAEQMAKAHARIPQITIVEEVDVSGLERLRGQMNADRTDAQPKLTLLPFLIRGVAAARSVAPQVNARFDDEAGVLRQYRSVHFGIATQTDRGLVVPVLRHAEVLSVWDLAAEITRISTGARDGSLERDDLTGSTITVTSLGPLGALATTPIINHPEVAIVGVNRKQIRPHWDGRSFVPREMMNLSASFDHRIVDGWDAANFIARLKTLLETPALLFA